MAKEGPQLRLVHGDPSPPVQPRVPTLDEAFRDWAPWVAGICFRLTGRREEVDDLVQDVFLAAHGGLERLRNPESLRAWLAGIAVRVCRRRLRALKFRQWVGLADVPSYLELVDGSLTSPDDRALLVSVYRCLDRLPLEQRLAWVLRHVQGEQLEDVATLCGCSLATAKRRIAAADAFIQEVMRER